MTRVKRDGLGWVTSVTDPLGHLTSISRDVRGQATSTSPTPWAPSRWRRGTRPGALTSVTDAMGSVTSLVHDAAGRTSGARYADGTTRRSSRRPGRCHRSVGRVRRCHLRTYDALRVTSVADCTGHEDVSVRPSRQRPVDDRYAGPDDALRVGCRQPARHRPRHDGTPDVAFTYDRDGRRTSMTDGTGTTTYSTTCATGWCGSPMMAPWRVGRHLGYARRADQRHPDGPTVSYGRDALGRMVSVGDSSATSAGSPTTPGGAS